MRRRGKDRAVEQIFPIAGEFLAGDDGRGDRMTPSALGGKDRLVAGADPHPRADLERRHVEAPERLHQTEAGLLVVAEHGAPGTAPPTLEVSQIDSASVIR